MRLARRDRAASHSGRNRARCKGDIAGKVLTPSYNDFNPLTSLWRTGGNKINVAGMVGDATPGDESVVAMNTRNGISATAQVRGSFFVARVVKWVRDFCQLTCVPGTAEAQLREAGGSKS